MWSLVGWLGPGGRERHEFLSCPKLRERHGETGGVGLKGLESRQSLACAALRREEQVFLASNQLKRPHHARQKKKKKKKNR